MRASEAVERLATGSAGISPANRRTSKRLRHRLKIHAASGGNHKRLIT